MTLTFEDVASKVDGSFPVGPLLAAWKWAQKQGGSLQVNDVVLRAGEIRRQQDALVNKAAGRTVAVERRLRLPTVEQHGKMLVYALTPTAEHCRWHVMLSRKPPGRDVVLSETQKAGIEGYVESIARATGFQPDDVREWILTDKAPSLGVLLNLRREWVRLMDGRRMRSSRVTVEIHAPILTETDIRAAARDIRGAWREHGTKRWAAKDLRLMRAVHEAGGAPRGKGMLEAWARIAQRARLGSWQAAAKRWGRVTEKAERFGVPVFDDTVQPRRALPDEVSAAIGTGIRRVLKERPRGGKRVDGRTRARKRP